jgi:hypothetical protein
MGPGYEGRMALSDDAPDTEAHLIAAREAFRDTHDIIEVFGGFLAVPAGTPIVQSTTIGGLTGKLRRLDHAAEPLPDTAFSMEGRNANRLLDLRFAHHYPAEGICSCGEMIRQESADKPWVHTGRMPGEPHRATMQP